MTSSIVGRQIEMLVARVDDIFSKKGESRRKKEEELFYVTNDIFFNYKFVYI